MTVGVPWAGRRNRLPHLPYLSYRGLGFVS
jgi:hypothetical protein